MTTSTSLATARRLAGERVVLIGRFASMSQRDAQALIVQQGGRTADRIMGDTSLIAVADDDQEAYRVAQAAIAEDSAAQSALAAGTLEIIGETELWARLGLIDTGDGVSRLHTPAMLAELLNVPVEAIRRWHRQRYLRESRQVRRLPYFDFREVAVARRLAELFHAGCSLRVIDRRMGEIERQFPKLDRPLAELSLVVQGRQLLLRHGDDLSEPGGQLLIDFGVPPEDASPEGDDQPAALPWPLTALADDSSVASVDGVKRLDSGELLAMAVDLEDQGDLKAAAEIYRTILAVFGPTAETNFTLAELLYRCGDRTAARERYYAAIELDEDYVEARANLGCLLAEEEESELAIAAFRGALAYHADYADVHYHLADTLDRAGSPAEAIHHWQRFLELAPSSPWAQHARQRLSPGDAPPLTPGISESP